MTFTPEQIIAKAKELHDAECCEGCPFGVTPSWLEYAEIALRAEAEGIRL